MEALQKENAELQGESCCSFRQESPPWHLACPVPGGWAHAVGADAHMHVPLAVCCQMVPFCCFSPASAAPAHSVGFAAKIDALKKKLGVAVTEETDEKTRIHDSTRLRHQRRQFVPCDPSCVVLAVFKAFDTDGNGVIDRSEFDVLAFKCGSDIEALVPENLDKAFNELAKDGKISFDQFYQWLKVDKSGSSGSSKKDLSLLRLKLQSKVSKQKGRLELC